MVRNEAELVEAAAAGDPQAFGEIVARYQSLVCAIAYSGTGDFALSQELAQDTFVAAWKGLAQLREPGKLKAWLSGIARNIVKGARKRAPARTEPLESAGEPAATAPSPLEQVLEHEEEALVWQALGEIPEAYREPLVLFYREGREVARVAEALDLGEDAVRQRLSRGRQMLKAQVGALVESALARTRPGKAFTVAVMAALPAAVPQAVAAGVAVGAAKASAAAKGATAASLAGALTGPLLGVAGAYVGARASILNTRSPRERRFMVRMTWVFLGLALVFGAVEVTGLVFLPSLFATLNGQLIMAGVYGAGLVALILRGNREQRRIQIEDGTFVDARVAALGDRGSAPPRAIYASYAGGVFGSLCWMPIMATIAGDHGLAVATIAFALIVYFISVRAALRAPRSFSRISMAETAAVGIWTALIVNWRWEVWMAAYRRTSIYDPMGDLPLWAINLLLGALFAWMFLRLSDLDRKHRSPGPPAAAGS